MVRRIVPGPTGHTPPTAVPVSIIEGGGYSDPVANILNFFADDATSGFTEASAGEVYYIRIYDGTLTAQEVSDLYNATVPIAPATWGKIKSLYGD